MSSTRFWALPLLLLVVLAPLRAEDEEPPWGPSTTEISYWNGDKVETTTRTRGTDPVERESVSKSYRASYGYVPTGPYGGYVITWTHYRTSTSTNVEGTTSRSSTLEIDQPGPGGIKERYEAHQRLTIGAHRTDLVKNSIMHVEVLGPTGAASLTQHMASNCHWRGTRVAGWDIVDLVPVFGNVLWTVTRDDPMAPAANGTDNYMRVTNYEGGEIMVNTIFCDIGGVHRNLQVDHRTGDFTANNVIVAPERVREETFAILGLEQRSLPWKAWNTSFLPSDWWDLIAALLGHQRA